MQFQRNISLLLGRMDPRRRVEFYPDHRGLHAGEFQPSHGELGRGHKMCVGRLCTGCRELHADELHTQLQ
jgi:hypothetical protein